MVNHVLAYPCKPSSSVTNITVYHGSDSVRLVAFAGDVHGVGYRAVAARRHTLYSGLVLAVAFGGSGGVHDAPGAATHRVDSPLPSAYVRVRYTPILDATIRADLTMHILVDPALASRGRDEATGYPCLV